MVKQLALAFLLLLAVASCAKTSPLEVKNVWARDTVGRTDNAAVFMTITSGTPDRLVSASAVLPRRRPHDHGGR